MKSIKATGTKIFVKIIKTPEETTESGIIIIPEQFISEPQICCEVISVGEKISSDIIHPGQIIVCHPNAGMSVMFEKENPCKILNFDEIYGVFCFNNSVS
jgi:co-chaperonin GroES (HSP10)